MKEITVKANGSKTEILGLTKEEENKLSSSVTFVGEKHWNDILDLDSDLVYNLLNAAKTKLQKALDDMVKIEKG